MKILIIPDSFKGSLTSKEVCNAIKNGLIDASRKQNIQLSIETIPFSDGGEGFSECLSNLTNAISHTATVHDIYNIQKECNFYTFDSTAIIDTASASGLQKKKNIMSASSVGTGELIKAAYNNGYKNIILGLGGTGCSDGGIGALSQLGIIFYDELFNPIQNPKAIDLNNIFGISLKNNYRDLNITYACDVDNTFYGSNGANYVFAQQKGARKTDIEELDEGFKRLNAFFKTDISQIKGSGAAGGICGGLYAVFGGNIKSGFDILAEYSNLEERVKNADIIITGEGKTDYQTLNGKLPFKVAQMAKKHKKECIIISGQIDKGVSLGDKMISLIDDAIDKGFAMANASEVIKQKVKQIL